MGGGDIQIELQPNKTDGRCKYVNEHTLAI